MEQEEVEIPLIVTEEVEEMREQEEVEILLEMMKEEEVRTLLSLIEELILKIFPL